MSRASGRTWQHWVTGLGIVAVVLLGGWWRAAVILRSASAQEASPYAGMVQIPGGSFSMGRDDGPAHERPAHQTPPAAGTPAGSRPASCCSAAARRRSRMSAITIASS